MQSKIFTEAEIQEIERRKKKDYSDKFGLFSSRVRPKINELLEVWFPRKKELQKLLKVNKKGGKHS